MVFWPLGQTILQCTVHELIDMSTGFADRECAVIEFAARRVNAGNIGIQGFESVNKAVLCQAVQCTVDLGRGVESMIADAVEQFIGAKRTFRLLKGGKDLLLVGGQSHTYT